MRPRAPSSALVVVAIFVVTAALNLLPATDLLPPDVPHHEDPIAFRSSDDLLSLTENHDRFARTRYLFYLHLGEVADGRPVVTFPDSSIDASFALGLARVRLLVDGTYEPRLDERVAARLLELPRYEGQQHTNDGLRTYVIVRAAPEDGPDGARLRATLAGDSLVVVDEELLEEIRGQIHTSVDT